ncbi:hypothetical protein O9992_23865 [Vibrio lentus]|nr:hypothetical protein [Vibrio lentus]
MRDLNLPGKRTIQRAPQEKALIFREVKESLAFDFAAYFALYLGHTDSGCCSALRYADASQFIRASNEPMASRYQWKSESEAASLNFQLIV